MNQEMNCPGTFYRLPEAAIIEVRGADAATVLNNLCTADIAKQPIGTAVESFVTNVRGWVVAHGMVVRGESSLQLWTQHPDPVAIANHIDRYIIREDAAIGDLSRERSLLAVQPAEGLHPQLPDELAGAVSHINIEGIECVLAPVAMLSEHSRIVATETTQLEALCAALCERGGREGESVELEWARIEQAWPRMGIEIAEKTIPQELDRDTQAISFTKGCYLGQETIARLDALGQLQKKLTVLNSSEPVQVGAELHGDGKVVGKITSVATDSNSGNSIALAIVRRGFFTKGTKLTCGSLELVVQR